MPEPALIAGTALGALPVGWLVLAVGGYAWQAGRHLADRLHGKTRTSDQQLAELRDAWNLDNPPPVEPAGHPLDPQVVEDLPARPAWDANGNLIRDAIPDENTDTLTGLRLVTTDPTEYVGQHRPADEYVGRYRPPADDDRPTARIARYVDHPIPTQGGHR